MTGESERLGWSEPRTILYKFVAAEAMMLGPNRWLRQAGQNTSSQFGRCWFKLVPGSDKDIEVRTVRYMYRQGLVGQADFFLITCYFVQKCPNFKFFV